MSKVSPERPEVGRACNVHGYHFSYERSSSWVGPAHFCYLLEPCRLKARPVQNAAPETSAAPQPERNRSSVPEFNFLNPAFELTLRRALFPVLVGLRMLLHNSES